MQTTFKFFFACLICFILLFLNGCGNSEVAMTNGANNEMCNDTEQREYVLINVDGTVIYDGQPVAEATVTFLGIDGRSGATFITNRSGRFSLFDIGIGIPLDYRGIYPGDYRVTISKKEGGRRTVMGGRIVYVEEEGAPQRSLLPPRYAQPETSGILVTLSPGENEFVFELGN